MHVRTLFFPSHEDLLGETGWIGHSLGLTRPLLFLFASYSTLLAPPSVCLLYQIRHDTPFPPLLWPAFPSFQLVHHPIFHFFFFFPFSLAQSTLSLRGGFNYENGPFCEHCIPHGMALLFFPLGFSLFMCFFPFLFYFFYYLFVYNYV